MNTSNTPKHYLEPTQESGRHFVMKGLQGEVVMMNLLRFKTIADYSAHPALRPEQPISGAAAFDRYIEHTKPFLEESGGKILFIGKGDSFLIGPQEERWDLMMLIQQKSADAFLAFANHQEYLKGIGHRLAAIEDSRLLPLSALGTTG